SRTPAPFFRCSSPSSPTRRSSDLVAGLRADGHLGILREEQVDHLLGGGGSFGVAPPGETQGGGVSFRLAPARDVGATGGEGGAGEGGQGQGGERGAAGGDHDVSGSGCGAGTGEADLGQCSGCIPSSTVRISSATSAASRLPNRDSSPRRASSSPKPTPEAGVTSGGRTTSDRISRAESTEAISSPPSTVSISSCSSGNEVTPRSILRAFAASGSRSRKSTSVAASSGAAVLLAIDQYIEALLTICGSPLVRAGSRSSCSGEPEDAWK